MDLLSTPIQNPAVLSRKILDEEMVLVNADNAASLALSNRTAVAVWELVDGNHNIQDIVKDVQHRFKDVPETVSEDVWVFIEMLARDGFIGFEWNKQ